MQFCKMLQTQAPEIPKSDQDLLARSFSPLLEQVIEALTSFAARTHLSRASAQGSENRVRIFGP